MRIAICDDQQSQLDQIRQMILDWKGSLGNLTIRCFDNGDDLLQAHRTTPF